MLVSEVANDRVRLASDEAVVVDHGNDAEAAHALKGWIVGGAKAATPVLPFKGKAELVANPQHLAHVDRVGAPIDLQHDDVSSGCGA